jgi:hypothetical protein
MKINVKQSFNTIKSKAGALWGGLFPVKVEEEVDHSFFQGLLQFVLWLAFAAFLFASLPHVAYFFASFEPESNGQVDGYWWLVSYALAIGIDVTSFLLSLNVAIKMRRATSGLAGIPKLAATIGVVVTHWPFILLLVGFSWLVNFEHAKEFHSSMLALAENADINLLFWQGKLADLNPIIASAFPVLAVAYTGMSDRIGGERRAIKDVSPVVQPVAEQPPAIDTEKILQSVQEMHTTAMQDMLDKFKVVTIELVKETVERQIATIALPQIEAPVDNPVEVDDGAIQGSMPETVEPSIITVEDPIQGSMPTGRYTSPYALQIEQLYSENAEITIPEIMEVTGCARVTAEKWLGRMKPSDEG